MSSLEILICAAMVMISGFLAGAEIALFSLSRFQLRSLKERARPLYRRIKKLLGDPAGLLITILVTNEIVNITLSTLVAQSVSLGWESGEGVFAELRALHETHLPTAPDWFLQMLIGLAISTPIVMIFGEITPKTLGARANDRIARVAVAPLTLLYRALTPVRLVLQRVVLVFSRLVDRATGTKAAPIGPHDIEKTLIREEEFMILVEEGHKEGAIESGELELIRNVLELDDTRVSDVYTPIAQVKSLPSSSTIPAALAALKSSPFSRIPVTSANRKKVLGVLYSKDLLLTRLGQPLPDGGFEVDPGQSVSSLMRRPIVVPPSLHLNALFRRMKKQQTHLAVVENPQGEAIGIVTMSDVLAALFDELLPDEEEAGA